MLLKRFYDEGLSQASWLVGCQATGEALVIDANRDIDQYLHAAADEGLRVTHVTETPARPAARRSGQCHPPP